MLPKIESPLKVALFFDFDGTLVELAPTPDAVDVKPEIRTLINDLSRVTGRAVAIITGRKLDSLDGWLKLPYIPASGSHGAEWRLDNGPSQFADNSLLLPHPIVQACENFASSHQLIFESKGYAVALHYRDKPGIEKELNAFLNNLLSEFKDFVIQQGKFVREIKHMRINKGIALERFMRTEKYMGRQAWYFGDDVTDEAAFAWVNANRGISVKVGEGETIARYRVSNPAELISYLQNFILGEGPS